MDASAFSRILASHNIGMIQPWDHDSSDLSPTETLGGVERKSLYVPSFGGNQNSTAYGADVDAEPTTNWLYTMCFVLLFFAIICVSLVARDGVPFCCRFLPHYSQHPLVEGGDVAALTEEQRRERHLEKQRQERRLWYSYYLKPYLTVSIVFYLGPESRAEIHVIGSD